MRLVITLLLASLASMAPTHAGVPASFVGQGCYVADFTGTPLNVRAVPNGRPIIGTLPNKTYLEITSFTDDRRWVRIAVITPGFDAMRGGFVFADHLACFDSFAIWPNG